MIVRLAWSRGERMSDPAILLHHAALPARLDPALQSRWLAALPAGQAERLGRRRSDPDRIASLLGIALLIDCARAAGLEPPSLSALEFPVHGKPAWHAGPDFSISHATGRVGCALAPAGVRVGLDLEARGAATGEQLRLVSSVEERSLYETSRLTADDLWTAKEAVVKAAGADLAAAGGVSLQLDAAVLDGVRYVLIRPLLAPGFACTVASTRTTTVVAREAEASALLRRDG
jgi:phosphopantetheinyl transferase